VRTSFMGLTSSRGATVSGTLSVRTASRLTIFRRPPGRARHEERYMTELFPDAYPEYKRHSKMLIPSLL
jgi:protein-S-isoprenylcysteine O-methyltransferase Ste14